MITSIYKRDGREAEFDIEKIVQAILKAFSATSRQLSYQTALALAREVEQALEREGHQPPHVEQVQDAVERVLILHGYVRTAKAYILYRAERMRAREANTRLMKIYHDITFQQAKHSDILRENANINGDTPMGAMLKYGSEGAKQFNEMFVLHPDHARAHRIGDIHIHDLDFYTLTTTCCQIDLLKLFEGGFSTGHGVLREPGHIASYAALACIAVQSNQNDQHGGQSVVNFDYAMAQGVHKSFVKCYDRQLEAAIELLCGQAFCPAARHIRGQLDDERLQPRLAEDEMYTARERELLVEAGIDAGQAGAAQRFARQKAEQETDRLTNQAMEALIHNLNTMNSRAGAQTPFSSINYGLDTSPEGRMAIRNLLLATERGLGHGETPIFPIQIFRVKEGVTLSPGDPNYDLFQLACRVTGKRLFPNFAFQDAPFNAQYYKPGHPETEIAYMGCRTRVIGNVYDRQKEVSFSRGNLSFTSINLPRMAILAKGNIEWFFDELDRKLDLAVGQLLERFHIQCGKKVYNFPFLMGQGVWLDSEKLGWEDTVADVLKHGTLSVGFIGLAETLVSLMGAHHGQSEAAQNLGLEIIGQMRTRLDMLSQQHQLNFTLFATPAEGLAGRFAALDRDRFGQIEGVTDREYYTNGFHIPVYFPIGALEKIRLEAPYHALTNAGHITYVELDGDAATNPEAIERLVQCMHQEGIGYGSINHPVDFDPACGYNGIIGDRCPKCGRAEEDGPAFHRIRRITGYLVGTLDRFNDAKRHEERDRVKHDPL